MLISYVSSSPAQVLSQLLQHLNLDYHTKLCGFCGRLKGKEITVHWNMFNKLLTDKWAIQEQISSFYTLKYIQIPWKGRSVAFFSLASRVNTLTKRFFMYSYTFTSLFWYFSISSHFLSSRNASACGAGTSLLSWKSEKKKIYIKYFSQVEIPIFEDKSIEEKIKKP